MQQSVSYVKLEGVAEPNVVELGSGDLKKQTKKPVSRAVAGL